VASCVRQKSSGTGDYRGEDRVQWEYLFIADSIIVNPLQAIQQAQVSGPTPLPAYGSVIDGTLLFAKRFDATLADVNRMAWTITANFEPPDTGEPNANPNQPNPLLRHAVYDLQYIETEYVIEQAKNVEALTGGFGRAAGTLGPIVNAAYRRPDEPRVDTERNAVITIERNYANLGQIMLLNETYQRTTNSDACTIGGESIAARRLKYLLTRSGGRQVEGNYEYYPGITEIEVKKTTDLILDNVGYEYFDGADLKRSTDADGNDTAEPVNLDLAGALNTTSTTKITYRYLDEVAYSGFFA
jgi:hypothetical protein